MKKTVKDMAVDDRRVLVRNDFNVPIDGGRVADDTRMRAALPTLRYLIERGARVVCCSHLGRPGGKVVDALRMDPVADRLSELLDMKVAKVDDCVGIAVEKARQDVGPGQILMLENTRFHPEEKKNESAFAASLAMGMDLFVNDAFGAAHRAHASTEGVARHLPAAAGLLMDAELTALSRFRENPARPLAAVFGGAKISDKIDLVERFLEKAEVLMIGGAMANTFFKAMGREVGDSLVESDGLEAARKILDKAGDRLMLPVDVVVAKDPDQADGRRVSAPDGVKSGERILDIGPKTIERFGDRLRQCRAVIWNGPMGLFEKPPFDRGTNAMAVTLAELDADTCVGGGDSAAAVNRAGMAERMSHVSTGGGAFLEFMAGQTLPCVAALANK